MSEHIQISRVCIEQGDSVTTLFHLRHQLLYKDQTAQYKSTIDDSGTQSTGVLINNINIIMADTKRSFQAFATGTIRMCKHQRVSHVYRHMYLSNIMCKHPRVCQLPGTPTSLCTPSSHWSVRFNSLDHSLLCQLPRWHPLLCQLPRLEHPLLCQLPRLEHPLLCQLPRLEHPLLYQLPMSPTIVSTP